MVEEDAANVETLLRNMANRLTLVANVLHDMADTGVRPTEGDVKQMDRFFAQGQPFRDYKAASRQPEYAEHCATVELSIPENDWQRTLLESARRGEHIVRFDGERTAIAQARSVV